jgi:hypothetical protein
LGIAGGKERNNGRVEETRTIQQGAGNIQGLFAITRIETGRFLSPNDQNRKKRVGGTTRNR